MEERQQVCHRRRRLLQPILRQNSEKVAKVRLLTSEAPPPSFSRVRTDASFLAFSPLTTYDVIKAVQRLPDKSSAADPFPTSILKQVTDSRCHRTSLNCFIVCRLSCGCFPAVFRQAFITPIIKKPILDASDVSSYRPISNLSVLSKLLERLIAGGLHVVRQSSLGTTVWVPAGLFN